MALPMVDTQPIQVKTSPGQRAGRVKHPRYISFKEWRDPLPPFRNSSCPHYEPCLAKAALENLLLDCDGCPLKNDTDF